MKTGPEGFWWFRSGDYDDDKLRADLQERLPKFYGDRGYVDFQVLGDTLLVDDTTGKATLVVRVSEGDPYRVGTFEIVGNRRFSTEDLQQLFPFKGETRTGLLGLGGVQRGPAYFNQQKWDDATQQMRTLYYNNGYIYMQPRADVIRRTGADGKPVVDLRWVITEGQPAIVNKVEIAGNDVTHERAIRAAIVLLPGDAFRDSRVSMTVGVHNTRLRYTISDLGQLRRRGGNLQFGFPLFNDRYTRLFVSYAIDDQTFTGATTGLASLSCNNCIRSTIGLSVMRDTRIDLPFPTAGTMHSVGLSQSGGPLGGTGNFPRLDLEGRWYAPLASGGRTGGGVKFVMGLSTRSGFVFGNSPFIDQLFTMGGTQYGIPLRGYDEFSITPHGFDPSASSGQASASAFGKTYLAMTGDLGARLSQMFYVAAFYDAGNVWARAGQFNPTRLLRGAGIGLSIISPLGPIGIDWAYGFDRTDALGRPAPGWKLHFKLGNFF